MKVAIIFILNYFKLKILLSKLKSNIISDHSFEAPPISIREKRKIGQAKGSIEERSNKIGINIMLTYFRRGTEFKHEQYDSQLLDNNESWGKSIGEYEYADESGP